MFKYYFKGFSTFILVSIISLLAKTQVTIIDGKEMRWAEKEVSFYESDSLFDIFIFVANYNQYETFEYATKEIKVHRDSTLPQIKERLGWFLKYNQIDKGLWDIDDTLMRKRIRPIYEKIKTLKSQPEKSRNPADLDSILSSLNSIPLSEARIWLDLKYFDLFIPYLVQPEQIEALCKKVEEGINHIDNLYEQGKAYVFLGDYAREHQIMDYAISSYYSAKGCFYRSGIDTKIKLNAQGLLSTRMAMVFENLGGIYAIEKQNSYYLSACIYFMKAGNGVLFDETYCKYLLNSAHLVYNPEYYTRDSLFVKKKKANLLSNLIIFYTRYVKDSIRSNGYQGLTAIGAILEGQDKHKEAAVYYLKGLLAATQEDDIDNIYEGLGNMSTIYSKLGKEKLANEYADLSIKVSERTDDRVNYYRSILEKAYMFFFLRNYDSCLAYARQVPFVHNVKSMFDLFKLSVVDRNAYYLMYRAFSNTNPDSLLLYKTEYQNSKLSLLGRFVNYTQAESNAIAWWTRNIKDDEIVAEKKNEKLLTTIIIYLCAGVAFILSLFLVNQRRLLKKQNLKSAKFEILAEDERGRRLDLEKENEINKLRVSIQQGKQHEFKSFVEQIAAITKIRITQIKLTADQTDSNIEDQLSEIITLSKAVSQYSNEYYETSKDILTTVESEINMAKSYLNVFELKQSLQGIIKINNKIEDRFVLTQLPVPSHFLNNFIMNSIKHGLKGEETLSLNIDITCRKTINGYIIEIIDDGCGINYTRSNKLENNAESSGFAWAKALIDVYNRSNSINHIILFNSFSITDNSDTWGDKNKGTKITIEFMKK